MGWTVVDNVVYNTGWESFFLHYGKENIVSNNVFARAQKGKLDGRDETRAAWAVDWSEKHLSLTFTHNVIYDQHTKQTANGDFRIMFGAQRDVKVDCDSNLYFNTNAMDIRFGDARLTWQQWQEKGQDKHGVNADPLFLHADQCDFFHLDTNSPAIAMGFKPIQPVPHWKPGCKEGDAVTPSAAAPAAKESKPQLPPPSKPAATPAPAVSTSAAASTASLPAAALTLYVVPFALELHSASNIAAGEPDGSLQLPFPSITAALTHLSGLETAEYPVHIALYPCYHLLNETLRLSEAQSGRSAAQPLVIRSMEAGDAETVRKKKQLLLIKDGAGSLRYRADMLETEQPVISGGLQLRGWQQDGSRKELWSVELPKTTQVTQLFVDGRRVNRTRLPGAGQWSWKGASANSRDSFTADSGQLETVASLQGVEAVMYNGFTSSRHRLLSFDSASRSVKLSHPAHWQLGSFHSDRRYHIENVKEGLTQPNSFWWDAAAGRLWYHCDDAQADVNTLLTVVPQLQTVLQLAGQQDSGKRLQWLQLADIAIAHSSWQLPDSDSSETEYPLASLAQHCYRPHLLRSARQLQQCAYQQQRRLWLVVRAWLPRRRPHSLRHHRHGRRRCAARHRQRRQGCSRARSSRRSDSRLHRQQLTLVRRPRLHRRCRRPGAARARLQHHWQRRAPPRQHRCGAGLGMDGVGCQRQQQQLSLLQPHPQHRSRRSAAV